MIVTALLLVAILLILGIVARQGLLFFRWLYIPASVIAGFVGLFLIQSTYAYGGTTAEWTKSLSDVLNSWPGWLIAVVFAGMLLVRKPKTAAQSVQRVARQGLMVWIIVLGETAVGLLAVWLLVQPFYDVPNSFGMLIETGFAGGHGTAAAMGEVFAHPKVGLEGGKDLGMLMATAGLVIGIIAGILWINIAVRFGWVDAKQVQTGEGDSLPGADTIGHAKISGDSIDPLLLQIIWLALAFGVGLLLDQLVAGVTGWLDSFATISDETDQAQKQLSQRLTLSAIADFPLFIYTLFGGLIVQRGLQFIGQDQLIDGLTIRHLTATAMDILVVAAIASLNLNAVVAMAVPFSILFLCGIAWTAFCLLVLSRWLLPSEYWFQLGLINYGMSTGTTATGFVLLKMVDPELTSGAAEDYALAAPISAPFVGGGMITIALPLLVLENMTLAIPALITTGIVLAMVVAGILFAKRSALPRTSGQ